MIAEILAAVAATVAFAVLFSVPTCYYPYCGIIGGAGWLVYCLTLSWGTAAASFAATVVVDRKSVV